MVPHLPESDWKTLRKLREVALERFCSRVLEEAGHIAADPTRTPYARYLAVYEKIQESDDQIAKAFNHPRRSNALHQLAVMMSFGLLTQEELQSFTAGTQNMIEVLRQPMKRARAD